MTADTNRPYTIPYLQYLSGQFYILHWFEILIYNLDLATAKSAYQVYLNQPKKYKTGFFENSN